MQDINFMLDTFFKRITGDFAESSFILYIIHYNVIIMY